MNKKLIIITRIHATSNTEYDEFTHLWGGDQSNEIKDIPNNNIPIRVINGPKFYRNDDVDPLNANEYFVRIKALIEDFIGNDDKVMILYHPPGSFDLEFFINEKFLNVQCHDFSQNGGNTFYDEKYKPLAQSAAIKFNKNLLQKVWDHFEEDLERKAKINLLHRCLTPDGLKEAKELLEDNWKVEDKFEALENVNTKNPFDKGYTQALTQLRNSLLN